MVDRPEQQTLLELSLSIGRSAAEDDLEGLFRQTLPLLVRRTASSTAAIVRDDSQGDEVVAVTPRLLAKRPAWRAQLDEILRSRPPNPGSWQVSEEDWTHHGFTLTGYGVLVLTRRVPLPAAFVPALEPVLEVLAAVLRSSVERERSQAATNQLLALGTRQRALLDTLPFPAWLTDHTGHYLDVNAAFLARIGRTRGQVIGRTAADVLPADEQHDAVAATQRVLRSGLAETREREDPHTGRTYEIERSPFSDVPGTIRGLIGFRRDVTERVQSLRTLRFQAQFLGILTELAVDLINRPLDALDAGIEDALARAGSFVGVDRCYVFLHDHASGTMSNTHEWCAPDIRPEIDNLKDIPMAMFEEWIGTHARGQPYEIPLVTALPVGSNEREALEPQGIVSLYTVPLLAEDQLVGFVGFDAVHEAKRWSPDERRLLRVLAEIITNTELRRRHERELADARRRAATLARRLELATSAARDGIWEWDASTGRTYLSAAGQLLLGREARDAEIVAEDLPSLVAPQDAARLVRHVTDRMQAQAARFEVEVRLMPDLEHTTSGVPVLIRGAIERDEAGTPVRIAGTIVDLTERKQREQREARRLEQHAALSHISTRFVSDQSFEEAVRLALADIGVAYGAGRASLLLIDRDSASFSSAYEWCSPGVDSVQDLLQDVPLAMANVVGDRLERGEPVFLPDVAAIGDEYAEARALFRSAGIISLASAPLFVQGELVGVLGLDQTRETERWSFEDATLLRAAAELLSGAMASDAADRELVRAREAAEAANAAKSRFLSTISHELRTPMNGVLGMTELLLDAPLDPRHRSYLTSARTAARSLLRLLDDLLDHARIEQGTIRLTPEPTDLHELLHTTVELVRAGHGDHRAELILELHPQLPRRVVLDGDRLRQVVSNLATNALRNTREGSVHVRAAVQDADGDPARLAVSIVDTGVGIPEHEQRRIFEPFVQLGPVGIRSGGGTGLGLAIVRQLVDLMGGTVSLSSTVGHGTTVQVVLPLEIDADEPEDTVASPSLDAEHGRRILIAEDNAVNQAVLAGFLGDRGWHLDIVADGEAAIEAFRTATYDLVLMDCFMPRVDGMVATRALREMPQARNVPIIAVTADATDEHAEQCHAAGMDAIVIKPFDRDTLLRVVHAAWQPRGEASATGTTPDNRSRPTMGPPDAPQDVATAAEQPPVLDPSVLAALADRRAADGSPLRNRLLTLFAQHAPRYVSQLADALQADDAAQLRIAAHTLKSNAAMLGLLRLRQVCADTEEQAIRALPTDPTGDPANDPTNDPTSDPAVEPPPDPALLRGLVAAITEEFTAAMAALHDRFGENLDASAPDA